MIPEPKPMSILQELDDAIAKGTRKPLEGFVACHRYADNGPLYREEI
jgi:hypothetical protein